jgi:ABC-2 type transport system ATP-binding protein
LFFVPGKAGSLESLVEIKGLEVRYGFKKAVNGLSLSINEGEAVGLLGVNGAGKSSTLKALLGIVKPSAGEIHLFNLKPGNTKTFQNLGFAPEEGAPPDYLSGKEYLKFLASFRFPKDANILKEVDEMLAWFEIDPKKRIRDYSKGMKRRLVLAQAFIGDPALVVLDEPLNGLDPLMILKLRERINQKRDSQRALIYSSHILSEVEKCCSRVVILSEGKVVLDDSIEKVCSQFGSVEKAFSEKVKSV